MRYLSLPELLTLHWRVIAQTGGGAGIRDLGLIESALAQPRMTFGGTDLYPTLGEKAAALAFSLIKNHPFIDGNKRIGHAAMETFLLLNGYQVSASIDEQERVIMQLAASEIGRAEFTAWLLAHVAERNE